MKILTIVGKVDSRPLVYPLARALSIAGLTGVITDDGAYRRLFHGKGNIGVVSGVDIAVCDRVNEKNSRLLDNSGVPYDYLLLVSSDFIHPDSCGILACHGLDRSMMVKEDTEVDPDEEFFINLKKKMAEAKAEQEAANTKNVKSGKTNNKNNKDTEVAQEQTENTQENVEIVPENTDETQSDMAGDSDNSMEEPVETLREQLLRIQAEHPDKICIPDGIKFSECQIAYAPLPKKGMLGVALKDGLVNYCYTCEETKELKLASKEVNSTLVKLVASLIDMSEADLNTFLIKEEGKGAPDTGKKR